MTGTSRERQERFKARTDEDGLDRLGIRLPRGMEAQAAGGEEAP